MRLYKKLLNVPPEARVPDDWVLVQTSLPSPTEVLRASRLRYFRTLIAAGDVTQWGLLNIDTAWKTLVEDDLLWMHQQLWNSSPLLPPEQNIAQWIDILKFQPGYWKRPSSTPQDNDRPTKTFLHTCVSVDRVCLLPNIASSQVLKLLAACTVDLLVAQGLVRPRTCSRPTASRTQSERSSKLRSARSALRSTIHLVASRCLLSDMRVADRAGMRSALDSAPCLARLKTMSSCANMMDFYHPSALLDHDGRCRRRSDFTLVHEELYEEMALAILHATNLEELRSPLSWTYCAATLRELHENLEHDGQALGDLPLADVMQVVEQLRRPTTWPFLLAETYVSVDHFHDLAQLENVCGEVRWTEEQFNIPRLWGKHRIVLHAFAGRRSPGDLQFYLDRPLGSCEDGVYIHAVSNGYHL